MISLRTALALAAAAVAAACASGGARQKACAPVPTDQQVASSPVYAECAVDQKAQLLPRQTAAGSELPAGLSCARIALNVVVDSLGVVVPSSAKVERSTNEAFTTSVLRALPSLRYEPARVNGRRVAQLVHYEARVASRLVVAPVGSNPTRASAPVRAAC